MQIHGFFNELFLSVIKKKAVRNAILKKKAVTNTNKNFLYILFAQSINENSEHIIHKPLLIQESNSK